MLRPTRMRPEFKGPTRKGARTIDQKHAQFEKVEKSLRESLAQVKSGAELLERA